MSAEKQDAQRMLELYRAARTPESGAQTRVWRAVESEVATVPGPEHGDAEAAPNRADGGAALSPFVKLLMLGGTLALVAGALLLPGNEAWRAPREDPKPAATSAASDTGADDGDTAAEKRIELRETVAPPAPDSSEAAPPETSSQRVDPTTPRRPHARHGGAAERSTLALEMELLTGAQRALDAGQHARALQLLKRHTQRFPSGLLAEEREAARVDALCGLHRLDQAERVERAFAARFPGSPLAKQVRHACDEVRP